MSICDKEKRSGSAHKEVGDEAIKRIAAPMVGGLATSFLLELLVYPVIDFLWKGHVDIR